MHKKLVLIFLSLFTDALNSASPYLAGTLDPSFNPEGVLPGTLQTYINHDTSAGAMATSVLMQADNKIVVGGHTSSGGDTAFALARFNSNGSFDTTFNPSGAQPGTTVLTNIGGGTIANIANAAALQANGKILLAGHAEIGGHQAMAVARFNTDGSLDTTFNPSGVNPGTLALSNIDGSVTGNIAYSIAIQDDDKIILAGAADQALALVRLDNNGNLDNTFNPAGGMPGTLTLQVAIDGSIATTNIAYSVVMQPDQKIVVAGSADLASVVARFNSDGSLDSTFNSDSSQPGVTYLTNIDGSLCANLANCVLLQANGKIIIAGAASLITRVPASNYVALARLNTDGLLDTSFNAAGDTPGTQAIHSVDGVLNANIAYDAALQNDQKIVLACGVVAIRTPAAEGFFSVVRIKDNGELDASFNPDGITPGTASTTINGNEVNDPAAVAIQSDGSIVICGSTIDDINQFGLVRYLGSTIESEFAINLINKYGPSLW